VCVLPCKCSIKSDEIDDITTHNINELKLYLTVIRPLGLEASEWKVRYTGLPS